MSNRGESNMLSTLQEVLANKDPATPLHTPLVRILEIDVIPQLAALRGISLDPTEPEIMAPGIDPMPARRVEREVVDATEHIAALVTALLGEQAHEARAVISDFQTGQGEQDFVVTCVELMTPAAQELGRLWDEDLADFQVVTQATGLLQALLRTMPASCNRKLTRKLSDIVGNVRLPRILLLPAVGEQHSLGLSMLGRAFSDGGWITEGGPGLNRNEYLQLIRQNHFDVIGISISCSTWIEPARTQIEEIRKLSRNPKVSIIVGGPLYAVEPDLAALVGADRAAAELGDALEVASCLVRAATHTDVAK